MAGNGKQATPPLASPPSLEEPVITRESSTEGEESPRDFEPFPMDDINVLDSAMLHGFADTIPLTDEDFNLDSFDPDLDSAEMDDLSGFGGLEFEVDHSPFK